MRIRPCDLLSKSADWIVAGIFLAAACPKIVDPAAFADAIASYRMTPSWALAPLARFLPWFEALMAGLLILGRYKAPCRLSLVGLLVVYSLLTLIAVWRGLDIHCGCFGGEGGSGLSVIVRNSLILVGLGLLWGVARWLRRPRTVGAAPVLLLVLISPTANANAPTTLPASLPAPPQLSAGQTYVRTWTDPTDNDTSLTYHVNLPPDWRPDRTYPILLEWPGKGGGPQTRLFTRVYKVTGHIHVGLSYPPQSPGPSPILYATPQYVRYIRQVYDDVVKNFTGNGRYVFIGGYSAGGFTACGAGVSLMIRAGLRPHLAGILAGGCGWVCDTRYAHNLPVLLWYSQDDPNSDGLEDRLSELRHRAASLTVVSRPTGGHRCDNAHEGPVIRRFLSDHGPACDDFVRPSILTTWKTP